MWIEKVENSKGIRYKYSERFTNPATGKDVKVSVTLNSSARRYHRQALEMLQSKFNDKYIIKANAAANQRAAMLEALTFEQAAYEWLDYVKPTLKPATVIAYSRHIEKIAKTLPCGLLFTDFTPAVFEKLIHRLYYDELLSYSYTKSILTTSRNIMAYAQKAKYITDITAFTDFKIKRRPSTDKELHKVQNKYLERGELKDCLKQIQAISPRIALAMEFMALTGVRCGEMLALRPQDYSKEKSSISVNGTIISCIYDGRIHRGTPKNQYSYRTVFLNNRARQILEWFIRENKKSALWHMHGYKDYGYIFTNQTGKPYSIVNINTLLKKIHIPNKNISTHIFRHTHISILAAMGLPLKTIMQRVGHNNPNTTLKIYTHVTDSMQAELMQKMQAFSL